MALVRRGPRLLRGGRGGHGVSGRRYAEAKAKRSAGSAPRALLSLGAKDATVLRDGAEVRIPAGELAVGDVIVVKPGERVDRRCCGGRVFGAGHLGDDR